MHLIPEWRKAWRMFSVQSMALSTALLATWAVLPDDMRASIPSDIVTTIAIIVLVLGMIGRVVDQPKVKESTKP